ncbi:MAG: GNAT family N-acetyltransferase [Ancrocorticia sp.]
MKLPLELVAPDLRFFTSFAESNREWNGKHQDGAGLPDWAEVQSQDGFAKVVEYLVRSETKSEPGLVTCTYRWIVSGDTYLGSIALRHELTPYLAERGGHIGYGIRPSARRLGYASWALAQIRPIARDHGLSRVLVTCNDTNIGSARTIEKNGGILESIRLGDDGVHFRRYWIDLTI